MRRLHHGDESAARTEHQSCSFSQKEDSSFFSEQTDFLAGKSSIYRSLNERHILTHNQSRFTGE
jgi:hypothetical protein